jgi:hypothetical protein
VTISLVCADEFSGVGSGSSPHDELPVSVPNPKSESPEAPSSREGRLADTSLPELLARAYRVSFFGSLILEPAEGAPSTIRFVGGAVNDASGPWKTAELEWDALTKLLPPDTLEFARQHAEQYAVQPFEAVERLVLLPPESLVSARQMLTTHGVETLCGLSGDVRYAFVAPSENETPGALAPAVEPLALLASCFLVESQRERALRSVTSYDHAVLSVDDRARRLLPTLNGPVRAVLESLVRSPGGVQALRERNLLPNAELVAAVCALWITREITVRASEAPVPSVAPAARLSPYPGVPVGSPTPYPGSLAARPSPYPGSRTPGRPSAFPVPSVSVRPSAMPLRPGSNPAFPSVAPFVPPAASMPPPRKNSGFQRAERGDAERSAKEHAMELKVEEAWMRAESDPSRAHEITAIVNKAIGVFPKNPRLHYYLARLHIQANRVDEAIKALERVVELEPRDTQAQSELQGLRARAGGAPGAR